MVGLTSRYLHTSIQSDLESKMVFVAGPRQVGKTTLGFSLLGGADESHPAYFNWDVPGRRRALLDWQLPSKEGLLILDEIHKYRDWRNFLKGLYDGNKSRLQICVTGSARLDAYARGGDSLQGRYHRYRLHPLSLGEISPKDPKVAIESLLKLGGFPEPFLRGEKRHWRRWQQERRRLVMKEDLVDLERIQEIGLLELLVDALPGKIGSPLSIQSLREDLQVAHDTVSRWLGVLENLFVCFRISPYGPKKIRAVKKDQKLYLWDWSLCESEGARFENFVASHLLKYCHYQQDVEGHTMEIRYLRDTTGREVDFVVLKNGRAECAVECKLSDKEVSKAVRYFAERTEIPIFYQVHLGEADYEKPDSKVRVLPFDRLVEEMGLP